MPPIIILTTPPPPLSTTTSTSSSSSSSDTDIALTSYYTPSLAAPPASLTSPSPQSQSIIIALPTPRGHTFNYIQSITKTVYGITSTLAWGGREVDVVFYYYYEGGDDDDVKQDDEKTVVGPVFSFGRVVGAGRRGDGEGEGGVTWIGPPTDGEWWRREVRDGDEVILVDVESTTPPPSQRDHDHHDEEGGGGGKKEEQEQEGFTTVAVGGTFDHLHAGHKLLLTATLYLLTSTSTSTSTSSSSHHQHQQKKRLILGLTGPNLLLTKKHKAEVYTWSKRAADVIAFLGVIANLNTNTSSSTTTTTTTASIATAPSTEFTTVLCSDVVVEVVLINDPYGPTVTDEGVQALVVSEETKEGGRLVNVERGRKGWRALEVFVVGVIMEGGVLAGEEGVKMSSTERRRREEGGGGGRGGKL
ncbi:hypothetical protein DFH27DRAFT_600848 [Peziza echinospora]|nr:hypothetical protein DFH27DRAFT_600848 [Peziza echinospora]